MQDNPHVERLRKLLRLSKSDNEHEARGAKERAETLMREHNLSEKDAAEDVLKVATEKGTPFHIDLARLIGPHCECTVKISERQNIGFWGLEFDAERASTMFDELSRIAIKNAELKGFAPITAKEAWRVLFWYGFLEGIREKTKGASGAADTPSAHQAERCSTGGCGKEIYKTSGEIPQPISYAMEALECFSENVSQLTDDVELVIEHFRNKAWQTGKSEAEKAFAECQTHSSSSRFILTG